MLFSGLVLAPEGYGRADKLPQNAASIKSATREMWLGVRISLPKWRDFPATRSRVHGTLSPASPYRRAHRFAAHVSSPRPTDVGGLVRGSDIRPLRQSAAAWGTGGGARSRHLQSGVTT